MCALLQHTGWGGAFAVFGAAGMAAALLCGISLPPEGMAPMPMRLQQEQKQHAAAGLPVADAQESSRGGLMRGEALSHLLVLCYAHSVISWSFFITQVGLGAARWQQLSQLPTCKSTMLRPTPFCSLGFPRFCPLCRPWVWAAT